LFADSIVGHAQASPFQDTRLWNLSAADGGFYYSILVPDRSGVAVIGVYFDQGELGVLHAPRCR
jgi:hypothetical protein